jgi:hypothetical protein
MMKHKGPLLVGTTLLLLFVMALWTFWRQSHKETNLLIADDVVQLATIFNRIENTCDIISFEHQKNYINFLNVIAFEGSEVGPMNLKYPEKWEGPYLKDNPTLQEVLYQVINTKQGYFVVPGPGVRLSNGMIIDKDIIFDEAADILSMLKPGGVLHPNDRALAVQILNNKPVPSLPADSAASRILADRLKQM